jgi:hypothetical protein
MSPNILSIYPNIDLYILGKDYFLYIELCVYFLRDSYIYIKEFEVKIWQKIFPEYLMVILICRSHIVR